MKAINIHLLLVAAAILILAVVIFAKPIGQSIASTLYLGPFLPVTATTTTSFNVTTSTRILATTTNPLDPANSYNRSFASICTTSSNPVYLNLDGDKAAGVGAVTAIIAAAAGYDSCYEINDRNAYVGSVTASSTDESATVVNVKDYVVK